MKKGLLILLGVLMFAANVFSATAPTITKTDSTSSTITFSISPSDSSYYPDSLVIVMSATADDSSGGASGNDLEQIVTLGSSSVVVLGLQANYTYYAIARVDSAGNKAYSNRDTTTTELINLENDWGRVVNLNEKGKLMYRADSWRDDDLIYDSITLVGEDDSDSTIWYNAAPFMSINGYAWGDADSVKFTILTYAGYPLKDEDNYWYTVIDSTQVTKPGPFFTGDINTESNGWFMIKATADADCDPDVAGDSTYFKLRLNRSLTGGR